MKCIEDEIPFEVPAGWEWCRFLSITLNRDGERKPVSSSSRKSLKKKYDYYGASGVIDKVDDFLFDERLLLIGEDGANLITRSKPIAFFADGKYWVNNHAHCIDSTDKYILEYLCFFVNAINLEKYVTGSAQPKMNQQKMNSILVPLPPIEEQKSINNSINALQACISILEDQKCQISELISAAKNKILDLAIQGKLVPQSLDDEPAAVLLERIRAEKEELIKAGKIKRDKKESIIYRGEDNSYYEKFRDGTKICIDDDIPFEIPFGWEWCRLSTVSDIVTGGTPSKSYPEFYGNEFPFFKPADLDQGENTITPSEFLSSKGKSNCRIIPKYSTAVCCIGTIGKCGFLKVNGTTNQQINSVISNIDKKYMYYYCCSELFTMQLLSLVSATTIAIVNKRKMESVLIPIPPVEEQPRIVSTIESCMHNLNSISTI